MMIDNNRSSSLLESVIETGDGLGVMTNQERPQSNQVKGEPKVNYL